MDENGITKPKVNLPLTKANPKVSQEVTKPLVTSNSKGKGNGNGKGGMGETPRPGESSLPRELDLPEFHQVWDKWVAYRRERKLPAYKSLGLSALRTRLVAYVNSHGLPAVIVSMHSSIANNYNGIFEPKSPKRLDRPHQRRKTAFTQIHTLSTGKNTLKRQTTASGNHQITAET